MDLADLRPGVEVPGPVVWSDRHRGWLALSHDAVLDGLRAPWLSSDRTGTFERMAETRPAAFQAVVDLLRGWMVFRDPPAHTRLREPVRRAFTPRRVEALRAEVEAVADDLLDGFTGGDLHPAYARPLPALVIARLLDIPASDREVFQSWSDDLAQIVFSVESRGDSDAPVAAARRFGDYFRGLAEERRRRPGDDLVSALVTSSDVEPAELVGACTLLLFAGHETTANAIAAGTALLLDHPDQLERLRGDPGQWPAAADEVVRVGGPAKTIVRRASEPRSWFGADIAAGDRVFLVVQAGNHDPAVFPDPLRFDVGRDPNPHLGFGWGIHHCLGAPLARLEIEVALRRLFDRFPGLRSTAPPVWASGALWWAVGPLPVAP
jgi:cytochrome P450